MISGEPSGFAIDLSHVSKTYKGKVQALRGIEMRVHRGEIFGLLGPNGAGKSTLVKILMTVIKPTRCEGTMLGGPVGKKAILGRVGYLPEHHQFAGYLTGAQVLDFYGALCDVPRRVRQRRGAELLDLVGMTAWADKRVKSYSKGMRQRIGVAQALINDPELVLLDEPTDGVDPVGRRDIRNVLLRLKEQGKTVFVNSHLLSELELVCDRVAILVQGLVSSQGTIDELTLDRQRYEIEVAAENGLAKGLLEGALPALRDGGAQRLTTGEALIVEGSTLRIGTTDPARVQGVIDAIRGAGITIRSVRPFRPSLEDLFMRAVTDPNTGEVLAPGGQERRFAVIRQTLAIFVDAYRELNAKKMFWIVLILSLVCVGALACIGIYEDKDASGVLHRGITILIWKLPIQPLDYINLSKRTFYNLMFYSVGFSIWLTWAATILALVSTAGVIPDFITGGAVEMVLAKPVGRLRLFLTKYAAGLLFVILQVSVFALASWLVIGLRAGAWEPVLFLSIPIVVALFSFLFAFQVLVGMLTRSAIASLLITMCLWLCIWALHVAETGLVLQFAVRKDQEVLLRETDTERFRAQVTTKRGDAEQMAPGAEQDAARAAVAVMEGSLAGKESRLADAKSDQATLTKVHAILFAAKTVLPKTTETMELLRRNLLSATELTDMVAGAPEPERRRRGLMDDVRVSERSVEREIERIKRERSVFWVLGTSLLFEGCVVGVAAWLFCRRDF